MAWSCAACAVRYLQFGTSGNFVASLGLHLKSLLPARSTLLVQPANLIIVSSRVINYYELSYLQLQYDRLSMFLALLVSSS